MRFVLLGLAMVLMLAGGCGTGAPVSTVTDIQWRAASETPSEGMEPLTVFGTDRTVYVAKEPILVNADIATVERTYDREAKPAVAVHFTAAGSKKISDYTKSHLGTMMAIVIDGHLMLAVPISSEFSESALISGGMSGEEVTRLVTLLTATEIRPVD